MRAKIISIDFQKDFTAKGGYSYRPRPSVHFVKNVIVPFLQEYHIKISEILADYRHPRFGRSESCRPGTWGFASEIPDAVKNKTSWVKCMHSPIWIRKHIGDPDAKPGLPYQDPRKFTKWIEREIGIPEDVEIFLMGLTLDCCVLCVAQEFNLRGYKVSIIKEATDVHSGSQREKEVLFKSPVSNWATILSWEQARKILVPAV